MMEHGSASAAVAKGRGMIAVPLNATARALREKTKSLRTLNLTFIRSKSGAGLLVRTVGGKHGRVGVKSNARTEILFVLKKSVTVAPRPWARRSLITGKTAIVAAVKRVIARP